jgi:hypothetical protein
LLLPRRLRLLLLLLLLLFLLLQRGAPASVRSWGVAPQAGLLLFNMRGGRWCGNVGRQHRSNGIYFVGGSPGAVLCCRPVLFCHTKGVFCCSSGASGRSSITLIPCIASSSAWCAI